MKVIGCLIWWNESPELLAASVESIAPFCSHLVAVDGSYTLFPGATATSSPEEVAAIKETAARVGLEAIVFQPPAPWAGQEPEKRAFLFELAESISEPHVDWWYSFDADEVSELTCPPAEFLEHLATTELDVFAIARMDPGREDPVHLRRLFRAIPGLRATSSHIFEVPGGRLYGGDPDKWDRGEFQRMLRVDHTRRHEGFTPQQWVDAFAGYELATRFNSYGTDPSRPRNTVEGCGHLADSSDGCSRPGCEGVSASFEDCPLADEQRAQVAARADEIRAALEEREAAALDTGGAS